MGIQQKEVKVCDRCGKVLKDKDGFAMKLIIDANMEDVGWAGEREMELCTRCARRVLKAVGTSDKS